MANGKGLQKLEFQYFQRIIFMGVKQGTHIFWYNEPIDPVDYSNKEHETMWLEWNHLAKVKFGDKYNGNDSNKWIVEKVQNGRR